MIDLNIYVNGEYVKQYSKYDDDIIVCPRVGEYISLENTDIDDDYEGDSDDTTEVLVTKIVHDLEYDNINIYTQTKRRKTS